MKLLSFRFWAKARYIFGFSTLTKPGIHALFVGLLEPCVCLRKLMIDPRCINAWFCDFKQSKFGRYPPPNPYPYFTPNQIILPPRILPSLAAFRCNRTRITKHNFLPSDSGAVLFLLQ